MKYAKYVRTQCIMGKRFKHSTCDKYSRKATEENRSLIEMTEREDILKIMETLFKNMKDAGYKLDSYDISIAFSKSCSETQDVVQVVELDECHEI